VALCWVNSPWGASYEDFWHTKVVFESGWLHINADLRHAVNDGLMTAFFFVVGLEIKRELVHGELSSPRRALLPAASAVGGMIAPALIYVAFNVGGETRGWGIPMATDIAFALGVLSLLGNRVPFSLKVFLLALAIADDIGAILVIAVFYTSGLEPAALAVAAGLLVTVIFMNRTGVRNVGVYAVFGVALWLALFESGIHATLAGVILGLLTPASSYYRPEDFAVSARAVIDDMEGRLAAGDTEDARDGLAQLAVLTQETEAPLERLERLLHPWVSYAIVPLFALANAGVAISGAVTREAVANPVSQGVLVGLVLGKPLGIFLFTWLAVKLRLCEMPRSATWRQVLGVGCLAGIGFTVSLLIAALAFDAAARVGAAKLGILAASIMSGLLGYGLLSLPARGRSRRIRRD
jgi:NhaA family Na+:H+ antiporter